MLKSKLTHPEILQVLGAAGHHSKVLIADGNYPASSKKGPNSKLVSLNLMPGVVTCNQVFEALLSAVPVEEVHTMMYETSGPYALDSDPPVWAEYRNTIKESALELSLQSLEKWSFYDAVMSEDHVLTIQTADQQTFANILLTIGVRTNV